MELRQQITGEYLQLKKEARRKASIVYGRGLLVEGIGEMIVDPRGSMDMGIKRREMFDFDAFWERLKQNTSPAQPKLGFLQRVLCEMLLNADFSAPRKKEQWEDEYEHKETFSMGVDGMHLYRATLQVRSMLDGSTDENVTIWSTVPPWDGQHTVAEVHRFSGTFISLYRHAYRVLLWDERLFPWFMDIMFGKMYIRDGAEGGFGKPFMPTTPALMYGHDPAGTNAQGNEVRAQFD